MNMMSHRAGVVVVFLVLMVCSGYAHADDPLPLEKGLLQQAKVIIKLAGDKGYKNIGVLKFLAARPGDKDASDSLGTLNMLLAQRLELALILENNPKQPIGIIHNASTVAARTKGASHLNAEGRTKLFEPDYPLAWGKDQVKADAFVTGTATLSKDLKSLRCNLVILDRKTKKSEALGKEFVIASRPGLLVEAGESFAAKGRAFKSEDDAFAAALKIREQKSIHPVAIDNNPVTLRIYYDDREVAVDPRDGQAFVNEPREGQKVRFVLERDDSKERYGVVLKINGESSIRKQTSPDFSCLKWILDPKDKPLSITGFQMADDKVVEFRVLALERAREQEIRYSADVGTITMTVFRERTDEPAEDTSEEAAKKKIIEKAELPKQETDSYEALKSLLLTRAKKKGIIVDGDTVGGDVKRVSFVTDPMPVMGVTIVYCKPKGSK